MIGEIGGQFKRLAKARALPAFGSMIGALLRERTYAISLCRSQAQGFPRPSALATRP